jgi:hypothetical protein
VGAITFSLPEDEVLEIHLHECCKFAILVPRPSILGGSRGAATWSGGSTRRVTRLVVPGIGGSEVQSIDMHSRSGRRRAGGRVQAVMSRAGASAGRAYA